MKKAITEELKELEALLKRKTPDQFVIPRASDITTWKPGLEDKYRKVISDNLDTRFKQLSIKPTTKKKRQSGGALKRDFACGRDLQGKRPGTQEECFRTGRIGYWGLNKINKKDLNKLISARNVKNMKKIIKDMSTDIPSWKPSPDDKYQKVISDNLNTRFDKLYDSMRPISQTKDLSELQQYIENSDIAPNIDSLYDEIMNWNKTTPVPAPQRPRLIGKAPKIGKVRRKPPVKKTKGGSVNSGVLPYLML